ncbi:Hsp20/alpha crystallin family protein [Streptomyces sp. TS71-3]|uniref:Hsp20/alpha crystallin family protein n=1 Tax=Streptomyces sp. TS71-3 TaxID=2733862 RepID=UPI001B1156DE|nr:Hsp20/alpha crystallin family protein [Streptomyces sp. TS71-3]GHJ39276.1 alpha-crystallin [Streptomyces sp. TS71-3]
MNALARKQRFSFPDLPEWFEGFPSRLALPGMSDLYAVRIETYTEGDRYIMRAELPGIDVEDLDLMVEDGVLTIRAERAERDIDKERSEIRYGTLMRSMPLPAGADENDMEATYADGMLMISMGMHKEESEAKRIEVKRRST